MDKRLTLKAFSAFPIGLAVMGAPIFLAAWSLEYWQAWGFLAVFSAATPLVAAETRRIQCAATTWNQLWS